MSTKTSDLLSIMSPGKQKEFFPGRPVASVHEFYLSGTIQNADEYIDWFDVIRHANENDVVKLYINSYGGDLFTAIQFLRVLGESPASILVSVEGACMSAATIIFMAADGVEISDHSMFMFHNYSGGVMGKGGEMLDQLRHEREWSKKLLKDIYADFLTEEEIDSMLNNKDIWMDGDEVFERVKGKIAKAQEIEENSA